MNGKVKNLFDNPPCFRVNQKMAFLIRVFDIAQRGIGSIVCAICKPCPHGRFYLFAGLAGVHFIQNVEEWGKLILSVDGVHIVIDSDIADGGEVFGDFYTVVPTYKILRAVLCLYDLPCPGCKPVSSIFSFQGTMPHRGGENFCLYLSPFLYCVPLLPFHLRQHFRRDTVNEIAEIV